MTPDQPLFSRPEAAALVGVHPDTIREWAITGLLREVHLGARRYFVPRDEVLRLRRERGLE